MNKVTPAKASTAATDGPRVIITSRPTVTSVPRGMEHRFEPASITESEFLRLPPAKGRCRLTGLSRSGLVAVATAAGAFISARLPGRVRGAVLIDRAKLVEYLRSQAGKGVSE